MLLHWSVATLVLVTAGLALFREAFASLSIAMISLHKQIGLAILALMLVRLAWRLTHRPPPHETGVPRWEARLADTAHRLLYVLLIGVPATGWLFVSFAPVTRPLDYRGDANIPRLPLAIDDRLSFGLHEAHELMGFALIGLFLFHISGVVRRQWLLHDPILDRMAAPGWPRRMALVVFFALALWLVGLSLDLLDIRLLGNAPPAVDPPTQLTR